MREAMFLLVDFFEFQLLIYFWILISLSVLLDFNSFKYQKVKTYLNYIDSMYQLSPAALPTVQHQPRVTLRGKAIKKSSLSYFLYCQLSASEIPVKISPAVTDINRNKQIDRQTEGWKKINTIFWYMYHVNMYMHLVKKQLF